LIGVQNTAASASAQSFGDVVARFPARNDVSQLPASAVIVEQLIEQGYGPYLRACPPPNALCWRTDHRTKQPVQRLSDGKVPGQLRNGEWYGLRGWREYQPTETDFKAWRRLEEANFCIVTGDVIAFDIDVKVDDQDHSVEGNRARQFAVDIKASIAGLLGVAAEKLILRRREGSTSCAVFARSTSPITKDSVQFALGDRNYAVEVLASGQQVVVAGSHTSGAPLWSGLIGIHRDELPAVNAATVELILERIASSATAHGFKVVKRTAPERTVGEKQRSSIDQAVLSEVMNRRAEWLPQVLPVDDLGSGEWRVSSTDLERDLEEDLSVYPDGIYDHGTRRKHSPSSLIAEFGMIDASEHISFGGSPDYGAQGDEAYAVVGEPDSMIRRPTEAEALKWLSANLCSDAGGSEFPESATWQSHWREFGRGLGIDAANQISERWHEPPQDEDAKPVDGTVFKTLTVSDLLSMPDQVFVVDRHLPESSLGFLYGEPGAKKSFIALDWALHLAYGRGDWHGDAIQPKAEGKVLYLAGEGAFGMKKRVAAWLQHHGIEATDPRQNRFHLLPHSVSMLKSDDVAKLARTLRQAVGGPIIAVIVDTVSRAVAGADENLQKEMSLFVKACDALKENFGCVVLGVHHASRNGNMRGSTVLQGAGDFVFRMDTKKGKLAGRLICEKMKDAPDGWSDAYQFQVVHFGDASSSLVPVRSAAGSSATFTPEMETQVLDAIEADWTAKKPWAKSKLARERWAPRRLHSEFGVPLEEAERIIDLLEQSGAIELAIVDRNAKTRGYRVVRDDQDSASPDGVFS